MEEGCVRGGRAVQEYWGRGGRGVERGDTGMAEENRRRGWWRGRGAVKEKCKGGRKWVQEQRLKVPWWVDKASRLGREGFREPSRDGHNRAGAGVGWRGVTGG